MADVVGLNRNARWSWADLTRALNDAGVLYGTGRPEGPLTRRLGHLPA